MPYLIDTDILIYSIKNHPIVRNHFLINANEFKKISVITYGELIHGAKKSRDIQKNLTTVKRIADLYPVIEVNQEIMETFGDVKATLQKQGKTIDDMDLIIAATAITLNYTLVTNNDKHFSRISNLRIENWAIG